MAQTGLSSATETTPGGAFSNAGLLEALACPACYGALRADEAGLVCVACGAAYACPDGVPLLLTPEMATHARELEERFNAAKLARNPLVKLAYKLRPPSPHHDRARFPRMRGLVAKQGPGAKVMDLGVRERPAAPGLISFDLFRFPGVHVVGDAHRLPFKDASLDGVISTALLEHVEQPEAILKEMRRVTKPGGFVYVEVPFLQGYHPDPIDMRRYTRPGLEAKVTEAGFTVVESGVAGGPFSMLTWMLRELPGSLTSGKTAYFIAKFIAGWLTFWIKYLDEFAHRAGNAQVISDGFYVVGEAPRLASAARPAEGAGD
jgi:uncharacterized protein YbaR (Trm112 family)